MSRYAVPGGLALALLTLTAPPDALNAGEPPFGEPYPVLAPGSLQEVRGPHPFGENLALLLLDGRVWRTDATPEGTYAIGPAESEFNWIYATEGRQRWLRELGANSPKASLWRTDGTAGGTLLLRDGLVASAAAAYHPGLDLLFLSAGLQGPAAPSRDVDFEPWVSDGTVSGTRLLRDILPDAGSEPAPFRPLGDKVVFLATDPETSRRALWRSDGTEAGTRRVALPGDEEFRQLWVVGGAVYLESLQSSPDVPGRSLWRSDGTEAGTLRLQTFDEALYVNFSADVADGRTLWTVENDRFGTSAGLWITGGTPGSTVQLMPLTLPGALDWPRTFIPFRGALYFGADDGTTGKELWRTDGTPEGTEVAFETCPGTCSDFRRLHNLQEPGTLLIWAGDSEHGVELRTTDGTAEGTQVLLDLCPGPCSLESFAWADFGGLWTFIMRPTAGGPRQLWVTDRTPEGTHRLTDFSRGVANHGTLLPWPVNGTYLFFAGESAADEGLWALPLGDFDPPAPLGPWLASPAVPGFDFKVRISGGAGSIAGALEPACIPETVCVSGALPGRSEVFLRVVGPKPNGRLWPTLVKFSTSTVEVWVRQEGTGEVRHYRLEGARPGQDELPGLFDRVGFVPATTTGGLSAGLTAAEPIVLAGGAAPPPSGTVFTSGHFPGYRFRVRISAGSQVQEVRKEAACIDETLCLSGAIPGRSEVFLRIVGPKPNGRMWPTLVKFTTSTLEVWIEQVSTGETRYYRIEGARPGQDDLTGLFDRAGFAP